MQANKKFSFKNVSKKATDASNIYNKPCLEILHPALLYISVMKPEIFTVKWENVGIL